MTGTYYDDNWEKRPVFGFPKLANSITKVIKEIQSPSTIGIIGNWGTGKTTLLENVIKKIKQEKYNFIRFNAWEYSNEKYTVVYPLMTAILENILENSEKLKKEPTQYQKILYALSKIGSALTYTVNTPVGEFKFDTTKVLEKDPHELEQFISQNKSPFDVGKELIRKYINTVNHKEQKLIVFIDDLDRCNEEKVSEIFESIKIFFNTPGIIFISCQNLQTFKRILNYNKDYEKYSDIFEYLTKFIQIPFFLPIWTKVDIQILIQRLLEEKNCNYLKSHEPLIAKLSKPTPRHAKQLLNSLIVAYENLEDKSNVRIERLLMVRTLALRWREPYEYILHHIHSLDELFANGGLKLKEQYTDKEFSEFLKDSCHIFANMKKEDWNRYRKPVKYEHEMLPLEHQEILDDLSADDETLIQLSQQALMKHRGKTVEFLLSEKCKIFRTRNILSKIFDLDPDKMPHLHEIVKRDILAYRNECTRLEKYKIAEEQFGALLTKSKSMIHVVSRYNTENTLEKIVIVLENIAKFQGTDHPEVKIVVSYTDEKIEEQIKNMKLIFPYVEIKNASKVDIHTSFAVFDNAAMFSIPYGMNVKKQAPYTNNSNRYFFSTEKELAINIIDKQFNRTWNSEKLIKM